MRTFCFFVFAIGLVASGCTSRYYRYSAGRPRNTSNEAASSINSFNANQSAETKERLVIFNAELSITVKNPDSLNNQLASISKKFNGYSVSLGTEHSTIRVASSNLNDALSEIKKLGLITRKSLNGEDVTEDYTDFELRLNNATKARERYLELLSKAENVEAALKVEKELERLNLEIETVKGKMEKLKHLADFSTIDINITERKKLGVVGAVGYGLYVAVKWLFVRN